MQQENFRKLNGVIFTHGIHLESRVNAFWYCFSVITIYHSLSDEIGSHSRKPELFWNIVIVWYMALSEFIDTVFSAVAILI